MTPFLSIAQCLIGPQVYHTSMHRSSDRHQHRPATSLLLSPHDFVYRRGSVPALRQQVSDDQGKRETYL